MEARVILLEAQVAQLVQQVEDLQAALRILQQQARGGSEISSALDSPRRVSSFGSFSVVAGSQGALGRGGGEVSPSPSVGPSVASQLVSPSVPVSRRDSRSDSRQSVDQRTPQFQSTASSSRGSRTSLSWEEREDICQQIGEWVVNSLQGLPRGPSGRDQIPLSSRVWIVFQDFEGLVYRPARVFRQFAGCRALVKRGADCGDSCFVGLPSEREARWVVRAAGFRWPEEEN